MLSAIRAGDLLTAARSWGRTLRSETGKGYAFIERGWFLTKRYWAWEIVWVTYNIVNALSVTFIAKAVENAAPGALHPGRCQLHDSLPHHWHGDVELYQRGLR
jgi:hypothetical protein